MKYIGNKTKLLNFIESSMRKSNIPFGGTFTDLFGGTGAVGRHFKEKGFKVISNDIMSYSYIEQYVSVYLNKTPSFDKLGLGSIDSVILFLNGIQPKKGYVFENYAPSGSCGRQYFSDVNAMKIDAVRDQIEDWYEQKLLSTEEYYVLVSSLINAADFVANICGTYGAYLKIWRSMALKPLTLKVPEISKGTLKNEIYNEDANILINRIESSVLYIDPPYNERQYAPNFHVLESLAVWDKQKLTGKTGQREYSDKKSKYCMKKDAIIAFRELIQSAKANFIVVSYNNEGIIPREIILNTLKEKGDVKEYTSDYRRFRTERDNERRKYKQCDDKVIEHLYIVNVK